MRGVPIYLATERGALFGMLHEPKERLKPAVLIVPPFGYESVWAHRSLRLFAESFAASGHLSLRLDLFGTGDSDGDDRSPDLVEAWIESITAALRFLDEQNGGRGVVLFGVRLGALLALEAVERSKDLVVGGLLLAPVHKGRAFIREIRAFRALQDMGIQKPEEGTEEASGYVLRAQTLAALQELETRATKAPGKWLVYALGDAPEENVVAKGIDAEARPATGYVEMMQVQEKSVPPVSLIDDANAWLVSTFTDSSTRSNVSAAVTRAATSHLKTKPAVPQALALRTRVKVQVPDDPAKGTHEVEEESLFLGRARKVFGVVASPKQSSEAALQTPGGAQVSIVLLNWGSAYHVGATRLPVKWSRLWASRGMRVTRIDLGGLGETETAAGESENDFYAKTTQDDLRIVIGALREKYGPQRFVMVGVCAGATLAFRAGLLLGDVEGAVIINPLDFYIQPGVRREITSARAMREADDYSKAARSPEKWKKLLRGDVDFRRVVTVARRRGVDEVKARTRRVLGRFAPGDNIARDLRKLGEAKKKVALVFSGKEAGITFLESNLGREGFERLRALFDIEYRVFEGADHTFSPLWTQPLLTAYLTDFLTRRFR